MSAAPGANYIICSYHECASEKVKNQITINHGFVTGNKIQFDAVQHTKQQIRTKSNISMKQLSPSSAVKMQLWDEEKAKASQEKKKKTSLSWNLSVSVILS